MIIGIAMLIISFLYLLLTGISYYSKSRIKNKENKVYSELIIITFLGILLELICIIVTPKSLNFEFKNFVNRLFLMYILTWIFLFTKYIFIVSFNNKKKLSIKIYDSKKKINVMFILL